MERRHRIRLLSALVLGLVFATGWVVGLATGPTANAATQFLSAERSDERSERRDRPGGRDGDDEGRRGGLYQRAGDLTEAQEARIDSILRHHRSEMGDLHRQFEAARDSLRELRRAELDAHYGPRYRAIIEETREAIKSVMTPEQAMRYDSLTAAWDRRGSERDRGGDGRGERDRRGGTQSDTTRN